MSGAMGISKVVARKRGRMEPAASALRKIDGFQDCRTGRTVKDDVEIVQVERQKQQRKSHPKDERTPEGERVVIERKKLLLLFLLRQCLIS